MYSYLIIYILVNCDVPKYVYNPICTGGVYVTWICEKGSQILNTLYMHPV